LPNFTGILEIPLLVDSERLEDAVPVRVTSAPPQLISSSESQNITLLTGNVRQKEEFLVEHTLYNGEEEKR
jgi:hypothetical protein